MKLTVDCVLNHALLALAEDSALARLLAKANIRMLNLPLEAVVCAQHGLTARPDYPIAAIAAHVDGLDVGNAYWLRADPVHLLLQRDSVSLSEPVPLEVTEQHAADMVASLNAHFAQTGLTFCVGLSGAWYLRLEQVPDIQTTLPGVALDRNIFAYMPQGPAASLWLSYLNEIQMLMHVHPANVVRESMRQPSVNSVWLSGGGVMPHTPISAEKPAFDGDANFFMAASPFYRGLAQWAGLRVQRVEQSLLRQLMAMDDRLSVRLELSLQHLADDIFFVQLWEGLRTKKISTLTLQLGCYERTLLAEIGPMDIYKFWRAKKAVALYLT